LAFRAARRDSGVHSSREEKPITCSRTRSSIQTCQNHVRRSS
jgi:hypothetical protein